MYKALDTGFTRATTEHVSNVGIWEPAPANPKWGSIEKQREDCLALLRDFFQKRPRHVMIGCFRAMDVDGSGKLNYAEFARAMKALNLDLPEEALKQVFTHFDKSNRGPACSRPGSARPAREMRTGFDENGGEADGSVSLPEFMAAMGGGAEGPESRFHRVGIGKTYLQPNREPPDTKFVQPTTATGYTRGGGLHTPLSPHGGPRQPAAAHPAYNLNLSASQTAAGWMSLARPVSARNWAPRGTTPMTM